MKLFFIDLQFEGKILYLLFRTSQWVTMADNEQKALQLIAEAEKKLTPSKGFFSSLFGWVKIAKSVQYVLHG